LPVPQGDGAPGDAPVKLLVVYGHKGEDALREKRNFQVQNFPLRYLKKINDAAMQCVITT
jgi:hypothetical protein